MNPSVNDRLDSVLRALTGVILPALPAEASLAEEQTQLIIGQLSILRMQLDNQAAFEAENTEDFAAMGHLIAAQAKGGPLTHQALESLKAELLNDTVSKKPQVRSARIQLAIDALLIALREDGDADARAAVGKSILDLGSKRAKKDRRWFMPMGFDSTITAIADE